MSLSAADRVALILGRAIIRAEGLQVELDAARARVTELEAAHPITTNPPREDTA